MTAIAMKRAKPKRLFRHRPKPSVELARLPALMGRARSSPCLLCGAPRPSFVGVLTPTASFSARLGAPAGKQRVCVYAMCRACGERAQANPDLIERTLLADARRELARPVYNLWSYIVVYKKYYCDKIRALIQSDRTSYKPATGAKRHDPAVDLCGRCEAEFEKWLGPPPHRKAKADGAA